MAQLSIQQACELALQHHQSGRLREAEQLYRQILTEQPQHAGALHNLGLIAHRVGRHDMAVDLFRQAIALMPNWAEAYCNLANALREMGQLDQAIAAYCQAIAIRPNFPEAHSNLGNALRDKGQLDEAVAACHEAIALRPDYAQAYNNLGNALGDKRQLDDAIFAYRKAIEFNSNFAEAYNNLGQTLTRKGQLDEAIAACRQAIALKPNYAEAHSNFALALLIEGKLDEAIALLRRAIELAPANHVMHSSFVFNLCFHPDYDAAALLRHARNFDAQHARSLTQSAMPHDNMPDPQRRLRIGYVGPYFRLTSMGRFLLPLLAHHNHDAFEIVVYSSLRQGDAMTDRLRSYVDVWHNIAALGDAEAATKIRADGIDILVDLSLHTAENRMLLFARKPAPVQATWLGYVGTTGLSAMDYRISDPYLDPPGQGDEFYAEKTLRLPHCFWCYPQPDASPEINELPAIPKETITFGCFNYLGKVSAPTLKLWASLMREVKGSELIIHAVAGSHQEAIRQHFASSGVSADRIQFVARQSIED